MLFVGDDATSTQIAASLVRRRAGDRFAITTAGTRLADPGGRSDEMLVAMGLDPADEVPLTTLALRSADRVIVLGTSIDVARLSGPRYEEWDVVHDDLAARVEALVAELDRPAPTPPPTVLDRWRTVLGAVRSRRGSSVRAE